MLLDGRIENPKLGFAGLPLPGEVPMRKGCSIKVIRAAFKNIFGRDLLEIPLHKMLDHGALACRRLSSYEREDFFDSLGLLNHRCILPNDLPWPNDLLWITSGCVRTGNYTRTEGK